jgi:uncharacterized protein YjbJ (UPF0337 family)
MLKLERKLQLYLLKRRANLTPSKKGDSMAITQDTVNKKWFEIKGEIQKAWSKLSIDEIEITKGNIRSIAGLVEQKYGQEQEKFLKKFSRITEPFQSKKVHATESASRT